MRYARSGHLTVYAEPSRDAEIIGQLILNERIQVILGSEQTIDGETWVQINRPYEGYFLITPRSGDDDAAGLSLEKTTARTWFGFFESDEEEETEMTADATSDQPESITLSGTMLIGLGASLYSVAEEKGYTASGTPIDLYFEYFGAESFLSDLRFGVNTAGEKDSDYTISTTTIYAAYRWNIGFFQITNVDLFALGGVGWMMSTLSGNDTGSASGVGYLIGGGAAYRLFSSLKVGTQLVYFSRQQEFDPVKRYVGSNQLQLTADWLF